MEFIKVTSEYGVFFDRVQHHDTAYHINTLVRVGYKAKPIRDADVPPCLYRDFGAGIDFRSWRGGKEFYHPELGVYCAQ